MYLGKLGQHPSIESEARVQTRGFSEANTGAYADKNPHQKQYVVVVLLFYVNGKHLRSCRDGQLT